MSLQSRTKLLAQQTERVFNTTSKKSKTAIKTTVFLLFLFILLPIPSMAPVITKAQTAPLRFAVIGDYGKAGTPERDVANLIKSWSPNLIITVGDNNYSFGEARTIDANIGQYFHDYIYPYVGSAGPGADVNRFFPTLGNHDWGNTFPNPTGAQAYLDYFTLPGNERYYTFTQGPVQFFALDSDPNEPDGISSTSTQAIWLQNALAASNARWKIVYFHHAPYSSGSHGSEVTMRWPFAAWGASAVLAGHDHDYERLLIDNIPYFVNGLGGASLRAFSSNIVPGSQVRYNSDYGAMLVQADNQQMTFQFYNRAGVLIDSYTVNAAQPTSISSFTLNPESVTGGATSVATVTLATPAPAGGATVTLTSSNTNVATVPASINIPDGLTSQTFNVASKPVSSPITVNLNATYQGQTKAVALNVQPPALSSFDINRSSATGPCQSVNGKLTLNGKAPAGGIQVTLNSANSAASVPASVTIPANAKSLNFTISTSLVSSSQPSVITASYGGNSLMRTVTVLPNGVATLLLMPNPITGGSDAQGTLTLNCAAQPNQIVALSTTNRDIAYPVNSSILVPAGGTTATFTITTLNASKVRNATIKATANGISRSAQLTVNP